MRNQIFTVCIASVLFSAPSFAADRVGKPSQTQPDAKEAVEGGVTPPPVGTTLAAFKKGWKPTAADKEGRYFKLSNGATVQIEKGRVSGGFWEPVVGMTEADLLAFNYNAEGTRYTVDTETEAVRVYHQDAGRWIVRVDVERKVVTGVRKV